MADNVTLNSGRIVATDEDSGSLASYQLMKLVYGPLDTFTFVTASVGLPVSFLNTTLAVTNAGTFASQLTGAALTALELLDDAIATIGAAVPAKASQISGSDGTNSRVISTNTSGHVNIADAGGSITVDGTVAFSNTTIAVTNAGTFAVQVTGTVTVSGTVAFSNTNIAVTNVGTFAVQVDGAALTALQLLDNIVFIDGVAFTPASGSLAAIGLFADEVATASVDEGDIGIPRMTLDRKAIVTNQPHTGGGLTLHTLLSAATTNATSVKTSAGQVYGIWVSSINAAARYLKLYNKASAPTVGTDTPVATYIIPGATTGAGFSIPLPYGIEFTTGIAYALTSGVAVADAGVVGANEHVVNLYYK